MILSELAHCAIVLVAELIRLHGVEGVTCKQVSQRNYIPDGMVEEVAKTLESLSMITMKQIEGGEALLYLNKDPYLLKLEDLIIPFDKESFCGVFLNEDTGEVLPQCSITKYINMEREYINKYLRKRYRSINLKKWIEYADKNNHNLLIHGI